ncbi:MAG: alanine dehydrogenase [Rhizomicrobium sp.]
MRIGVPKEIKTFEGRVGLTPDVVGLLASRGHDIFVETCAGRGIGVGDEIYQKAGASIMPDAERLFEAAELIVKVKEPQPEEIVRLRPHHVLFTYLHLAADPNQARGLMRSGCTAIAYETVTGTDGGLPLLAPMSRVAGRMATQIGAVQLLKPAGGRGILVGGVPGVAPARVTVLGGGVSGTHAAEMALGLHADVCVFDISARRLDLLDRHFGGRVRTIFSTPDAIAAELIQADLVIGCVLLPGASAPKLVRRSDLARMKSGAVLVDVAIDQGGCFETSFPTTHAEPTYVVDGIIHYCVANMPGAAPLTSTYALNGVTAPFVVALADKGVDRALADDPHLAAGLNVMAGEIRHPVIRASLDRRPD